MKNNNSKVMQAFLKKFLNADGTLNKTVIASFITLLIVLVQQIMMACGFSYGHWDQVVSIINTVLTLLGLCGFVEGSGSVEAPTHLVVKQGGFQPSAASKAGDKQDENAK